uniref:Uncharacterized protein n=1 Tax=Tetranychus urticae TaxID=32264 RepID=T1JUQ4_TETUR
MNLKSSSTTSLQSSIFNTKVTSKMLILLMIWNTILNDNNGVTQGREMKSLLLCLERHNFESKLLITITTIKSNDDDKQRVKTKGDSRQKGKLNESYNLIFGGNKTKVIKKQSQRTGHNQAHQYVCNKQMGNCKSQLNPRRSIKGYQENQINRIVDHLDKLS